jgi:hypothetical protein
LSICVVKRIVCPRQEKGDNEINKFWILKIIYHSVPY